MIGLIKQFVINLRNKGNIERYIPTIQQVNLNIGDKVGLYASSHGNIIAMTRITELMFEQENVKCIFHLGDIMDEHAGYVECLEYVLNHDKIYSIVGNHDLLIINKDEVHNYEKEYMKLAEKAYQKFKKHKGLKQKLLALPSKIETPFFSIVHESVQSPYYAKITKLKKKSNIYGKTPDENLFAVFNSMLAHPYFTGSDHKAYIVGGSKLRKEFIKPNTTIRAKGSKIISVPSLSLSKDFNYTHGYCVLTVEDDKSLTVDFKDLPDILINGGEVL
jgi:hypothetical protein